MDRLREGWWAMLVLCVAGGLWFLAMPLLGVGFEWQGVVVRPGWLGIPSCVFGAVYAASSTQWSKLSGVTCGVALFAATWLGVSYLQLIDVNELLSPLDAETLVELPVSRPTSQSHKID